MWVIHKFYTKKERIKRSENTEGMYQSDQTIIKFDFKNMTVLKS